MSDAGGMDAGSGQSGNLLIRSIHLDEEQKSEGYSESKAASSGEV